MSNEQEGSVRLLTPGEIGLARKAFGDSIIYAKVWIHHDSYLPFGLQNRNTAMSPNGELYFRDWYTADFSRGSFQYQHLFIHEMAHVWQHQQGMWVRARGMVSGMISYDYDLASGKKLTDYRLEQQAQIIADFFLLRRFGKALWLSRRGHDKEVSYIGNVDDQLVSKYQQVLANFPGKF